MSNLALVASSPSGTGAIGFIPLRQIKRGNNPRRHRSQKDWDELRESIRASGGVLQAILVRRISEDDDEPMYELIAGDGRYTLSLELFGDDYAIPALIIPMDDQEAAIAALKENVDRASMSPVDEAEAAARLLAEFANDRSETAKRLGWSIGKLDSRLALMNAHEDVRKALTEEKILLGHAELLAAVERKKKQPEVLAKLLSTQPQPTVAQLKQMLASVARPLETACFDKSDCAACPHNSSLQVAMFGEAIDAGHCTNGDCYTQKTETRLEEIRTGLVDSYPRVEIVRPGQNHTTIKLKVDGTGGVGEEQAKACRTCKNFGAAISATPGKEGQVFESFCFDSACNTRMVAKAIKQQAKDAAESKPKSSSSTGGKSASKPAAPAAPKTATLSSAVIEFRKKLWRKALAAEATSSPERALGMLLTLGISRKGRHISDSAAVESTQASLAAAGITAELGAYDFGKTLEALAAVPRGVLAEATVKLAAAAAQELEVVDVQSALRLYATDLTKYFVIDAEYLNLLTKSEIQAVAEEVGLDKAFGDGFKSLFSSKKDEIIKRLTSTKDFNFAVLPNQLHFDTSERA